MLLELIKSYKLKIEDLKARGLRGERALIIVSFLKDEAKFKTINIKELLELLQTANYTTHPLNKIGTTLEYIARNNLYSSSNYKSILTSVISSLETLKLESFNQEETDKLLERLTKLENSIIDDSVFITDFPLVKQIIRESNLAPIDIYNLMLEIDKFNKNTVGLDNIDKHTLIMNLLHKYGYNPDLTEYEKSLIDTIDLNLLEEKLDYFASIEDYDFLKTSIEHHRLVLLLLAPINNIKEIYRITLDSNLKVENIFGIFYFNKDYRLPDTGVPKDYFYQILEGSYETFVNNSMLLISMGCNLKETYENSSALFYMPTKKLENNRKALLSYNIPISIPTVLASGSNLERENTDIESQIDRFIEVGLYDYIKKFPQALLNKDRAFFHRVYYARKNGLPVKKKYLLKEITSINGYGINEENYLDKVKTYESPLLENINYQESEDTQDISNIIQILDNNYLTEDNVYVIENVYISRNKVIRLLKNTIGCNLDKSSMEILLYAILKGVLLDKDTFDKVATNVLNKCLENNLTNQDEVYMIFSKLNIDIMNKGVRK